MLRPTQTTQKRVHINRGSSHNESPVVISFFKLMGGGKSLVLNAEQRFFEFILRFALKHNYAKLLASDANHSRLQLSVALCNTCTELLTMVSYALHPFHIITYSCKQVFAPSAHSHLHLQVARLTLRAQQHTAVSCPVQFYTITQHI